MPNTLSSPLRHRLYRSASDGSRTTFSTVADRSIPLIDGVTILGTNDDLAAVIRSASEAGLSAVATRVGDSRAVVIQDRRAA